MLRITKKQDTLTTSIRDWNTRVDHKGKRLVHNTAIYYKRIAKALCPRQTGRLQNSIGETSKEGIWEVSPGGFRILVGTNVPYAPIVEFGVNNEYIIRGKDGGVLRFYWKKFGRTVFFHMVRHPPMKGKFFMKRAAVLTKLAVPELMRKS